jgi:mannose-1-phosphate guanylyltransferase
VGVVVLASDHLIVKGKEFCDILQKAVDEASTNSVIVTLGIKPNRPETGYGYIEVAVPIKGIDLLLRSLF